MYTDEYGVQFSDDKKTLIKVPEDLAGEYVIPEGTEKFDYEAFRKCVKLQSIWIPSTLPIEKVNGAFTDCENLIEIKVAEGHPSLCTIDGVLFCKDMSELVRYPAAKTDICYSIPDTVRIIDIGAFEDCKNLERIDIPDSVEYIDMEAFAGCVKLESIKIPRLFTSEGIAPYTFAGCTNLKSVHLPEDINRIDYWAFGECVSLNSINLPKDFAGICNGAFEACTAFQQTDMYKQLCDSGYTDEYEDEYDMSDKIEGEGTIRYISYYSADSLVRIDLRVFEEGLFVYRSDFNISGGFADKTIVPDIAQLMKVLDVDSKEDIIEALIERCKTFLCPFEMNSFLRLLRDNQIHYTQENRGSYEPGEDEDGHPTVQFVAAKK